VSWTWRAELVEPMLAITEINAPCLKHKHRPPLSGRFSDHLNPGLKPWAIYLMPLRGDGSRCWRVATLFRVAAPFGLASEAALHGPPLNQRLGFRIEQAGFGHIDCQLYLVPNRWG
jgi:hypothetical protein